MPKTSLLSDIKVADMTSVLFGPYCTQTLADMGADVVKIEPKHGDVIRRVGAPAKTKKMGPTHLTLNRGKRCVDWDPKTPLGKEATRRLIASSDVFIHNIRESAVKRLGLTFEDVKAIKPDIIYVHCIGFGSDGPYAENAAYDDIIQSLSGMTNLSSRVDGNSEPKFLPMAIADKVSALHAVYATLAAIIERNKTGKPVHVEVPMLECVTHFLLEEHFDGATFDPPTGPFGYERQLDPTRQPIKTQNGWIVVAPYTDDRWVKTFEVIGGKHELDDDRLSSFKARLSNRRYMQERLLGYLENRTSEQWLTIFREADIPAARTNSLDDLQSDPHLMATNFFAQREHPTEGDYWEIQPPVKFKNFTETDIRPAAHIGQDTAEVLKELNLSEIKDTKLQSTP